jgi:CDP-diacylglycerol--glycerol-3-phosphate 3-phosphatidyltransferase
MATLNLPTAFTLARLAAAPIAAATVLHGQYVTALSVFTLAAATDWVDGWLARKLDQRTTLGAALDHASDKALVTATLVALAGTGLPLHLVAASVLILGRDVAVSGLREGLALDGKALPVNKLGKLKTVFEMVAVGCLIGARLPLPEAVESVGTTLLWAAAGLALWSGGIYFAAAFRKDGAQA